MTYLNQSSGLSGFFDQLGSMLEQNAAQQKAQQQQQSLADIALASLPGGSGLANLPAAQPASSGGFFDKLFGGGQPAQAVNLSQPSPQAAPAPMPSPQPQPPIAPPPYQSAPQTPLVPSPVAWDKSRQSGGILNQLLGPQPVVPQPVSPRGTDVTGTTSGSASPDVPLPPVRPVFASDAPAGGAAPAASPGAPAALPSFAAGAPAVGGYMPRSAAIAAFGPQPDNTPNSVPQYGRSSADGLPTFAALQGAPTQQPSPGNPSAMFSGLEQRFNLPAGYLGQTYQIESGGNPNAYNKGSGAAGGFQFIPSTARSVGLSNPYDLLQSSYAAAKLASNNADVLRNALGRDPTAGELYLAHQQGAAGAAKLLTNPDAPASSIVGASAVKSNGGNTDMTAGQFAAKWTSRFGDPGTIGTQSASVGPYGALGGSPAGQPTMVAAGMPLTNATPFAPQPTGAVTSVAPLPRARSGGTAGAGGGVAYAANGQAVMTDAAGNALGSNGQPTTLAFSGTVPNGAPAAPASRAIATAVPLGDPLVTVPGYQGQWNKAAIAAAPDGTDVPDDDELARAQAGSMGGATRETVQVPGPTRAPGTANALSPAAPRMQMPSPAAAPVAPQPGNVAMPQAQSYGAPTSGTSPEILRALLKNPNTQALGLQLWQRQLTEKPEQHVYHAGDYVYDANNRPVLAIPDKPAETDAIKNFAYGQANPAFAQYQQDQQKGDKSSYVDVPLADGRMQKMVGVPGAAMSTFTPIGAPYVPKPGTSVTIDNKAESAQEGEYGKVAGAQLGEVMKAGATAPQALQQVAMLRAAAARAGDNLSTGPFGPFALKAKQAIGSLAGVEIPGTSEAEVINNIGYGLASQAARAISNRPTQMEFANALSVKPGLSLSPQGMTAVLNIREQDLKDQIALAKLASVRENRNNWPAVVSDYYDTHPVMSPFDPSRPLGAEDVQAINGSQQQAAAAPMSAADRDASLSAARAAIARGAPRDAVVSRLRQGGVDPSGL